MENFLNIFQKIFLFDKEEPLKIGLSQLKKTETTNNNKAPSINNKNVKLSDLMRKNKNPNLSTTDINI